MTKQIDKVGLAIVRNGELLLVRNEGTEKLLIPGGRREHDETDLDTLVREIREELSCAVLRETLDFVGSYSDVAANDPGSVVTIRLYRGEISGPITPAAEVAEVVWFDPRRDDARRLSGIVLRQILPDLTAKGFFPPPMPDLSATIALLARTPATLDALLRGLPESWTHRNEGEGTWSAFDVLGHLIHGERTDWIPRARVIREFGDTRAFEPFDRLGHVRESEGQSLEQLLDEFARLRAENLDTLRGWKLTPDDLARRGKHPALGAVTMSQLLATWAAHDLSHLHQLSRVMAHQYREATGPWSAYLGVLQCAGHSS